MAASVATVSAGEGAKPSVAVCRCVHVPCRSVCLCLCVLRHVACGMVARVHGDAMRSLRLSLRSYAECHQTAKGQKRFVPASKTRRHKQHTHASQSVSLSVCLSVYVPLFPFSFSLCLCLSPTHSSTVQAMLSRATGYCTLSQ